MDLQRRHFLQSKISTPKQSINLLWIIETYPDCRGYVSLNLGAVIDVPTQVSEAANTYE